MRTPLRILVVDDNAALRENVAEALALEGYDVAAAADGAQTLRRLERERFDVVLLDLQMPGMSGRELLAHLRADPRLGSVRAIVMSGDCGPSARAAIRADGFLQKPFGVSELLAALHAAGVPRTADDTAA
jgi:CheY-like chemotaxis protein